MTLNFNLDLEGKRSPWGRIQHAYTVAPGIFLASTSGHDGVKLDRERNALVDPLWRKPGGWYEGDCEWAIVALTFPSVPYFAEAVGPDNETRIHYALRSAKNYRPEDLAAVFPRLDRYPYAEEIKK